MDIKHFMPVLFVKDAKKSRDFYVNVLGLTEIMNAGDQNFVFKEGVAVWQIMEENIIPQKLGMDRLTDSGVTVRCEISTETGDIDKVFTELKAAGVTFLHEMNEEVWGQRTLRFYDPDGHLVEVGEAMPVFMRRIFEEEAGDVEKTARRTYTDAAFVRKVLKID